MGLFGKKVKFEDDDAGALSLAPSAQPTFDPPLALGPPVVAQAPVSMAPTPAARVRYGIEDAMKLMRTLPVDRNAELVVRVVRQTLESLDVRVEDIIRDAEQKEAVIQEQVKKFREEIAELEGFIKSHREEIIRLETESSEIGTVRKRLAEGTAAAKISLVGKVG